VKQGLGLGIFLAVLKGNLASGLSADPPLGLTGIRALSRRASSAIHKQLLLLFYLFYKISVVAAY